MPIHSRRTGAWRVVAPAPTVTPPVDPDPPPVTTFTHPGVMYSQAQLNYVKTQLAAGAQPWTGAYSNMLSRTVGSSLNTVNVGATYSSLGWTPHPVAQVRRHSSGANAVGDGDLIVDGQAALIHALIWVYKGTRANALKAIEILNAWSGTITEIVFNTTNSADGKLLAGWTGTLYARAAEIIRWTFTSQGTEATLNVTRLKQKFNDVWLPKLLPGHDGGGANWLMSFCDSIIQIAVFNDDQASFNHAVNHWRMWVPSIFYMPTDVPKYSQLAGFPIPLPETTYDRATITVATMRSVWWDLGSAVGSIPAGTAMESCRDAHHNAMGFAGTFNTAETARHQGVNLYSEQMTRLVTAMETNNNWNYQRWVQGVTRPTGYPKNTNRTDGGVFVGNTTSTQRATFELGYQQLANRMNQSMPQTLRLLDNYCRNNTYDVDLMIVCEQLTYAGTP